MRLKYFFISLCVLIMMGAWGCGPRVPRDIVQKVTWEGDFRALQVDTDQYIDEYVIFGGRIISTDNQRDNSEITVLQFPLDSSERPQMEKESNGRFLIRSDSFLDPEIYAPGKRVTAAGRLIGAETRLIGDYEYVHPIIKGDLWVWEPRENSFPRFHFGLGIGKTF